VNKVDGLLYYVYDQAGQLLAEVDRNAGDDFFRSYVYAEDELVGFVDQVSRSTGGCAGIPPVGDELGLPDFWWLMVPAAALFVLVVPGLRRRPIAATGVVTIALVAGAAGLARSEIVSVAFFWVHTDHLGTPLAVTDTPANPAAAKVVWRATYEAFGKATVDEDPDGDQVPVSLNVRFPGQYFDAESGLHYNYFRTYDPATGRYLEPDPIGQSGGVNLFVYANSSPVDIADRLGLFDPYQSRVTSGIQTHGNPYHYARDERAEGHRDFPGPENSRLRHCVVSCMVASVYDRSTAFAGGLVNEIQGLLLHDIPDLPGRIRGKRPWAFQPEDFRSNEAGVECADPRCNPTPRDDLRSRCLACCREWLRNG